MFSDFRIYQEQEISKHITKVKFQRAATVAPYGDDLYSTIRLTPESNYKHVFLEAVGRQDSTESSIIYHFSDASTTNMFQINRILFLNRRTTTMSVYVKTDSTRTGTCYD